MRALGVEASVVEGERGAPAEVFEHVEHTVRIARVAVHVQERDRAVDAPAREHREDGGRAVAGAAHEALVLVALRDVGERAGVGEVLDDDGFAAGEHARDGVRAVEVERHLAAHPFDAFGDGRFDRGGDGLAHGAVEVDEVDHAQLGELGHGGAREVAQRLRGIERAVERRGRVDQELQAAAVLAHAFEREVDDDAREHGEHDADARDGAEDLGHAFVGERQQERDERDEHDGHEASARLEAGGVSDREQVDQCERAARAAGGRAEDRDQHDAPELAGEDERQPAALAPRGEHERAGDEHRIDADGGDGLGRAHVRDQQRGRAEQATDDVEPGLGEDRGAQFAAVERLPGRLLVGGASRSRAPLRHPHFPQRTVALTRRRPGRRIFSG